MSLCFKIKLFNFFRIIYGFRIYLLISHDNSFPNGLIGFFESNLNELFILNTPEWVFNLNLLLKFSVNQRFVLWFYLDKQSLCLNFDVHLLWSGSLRHWDLDSHLLDRLTPIVFISAVTVICANFLHVHHSFALHFWLWSFLFLLFFFHLWFFHWSRCRLTLRTLCWWGWNASNFNLIASSLFLFLKSFLLLFISIPSVFGLLLWWESLLMHFLISSEILINHAFSDSWWETHFIIWLCLIIEICSSLEESVDRVEKPVNSTVGLLCDCE